MGFKIKIKVIYKVLLMTTKSDKPILSSKNLFINNDTQEQVSQYLDNICSDPNFLCKNKELCGTSTTIYTNVENVNKICKNIALSNKCENDFKECLISTTNYLDESKKTISTSFVNIIIPIPNEVDDQGNHKFLRLPALSGSKNKNSQDICDICECMNRFATSPGANNSDTSPGQNQCLYPSSFEHFYYPTSIENINNILSNTPPIIFGKYKVINSNIIAASSEEALNVDNLYELLLKNKISKFNAINFINKLIPKKVKELNTYILNKNNKKNLKFKENFYENITIYYIVFIIFIILIFYLIYRLNN